MFRGTKVAVTVAVLLTASSAVSAPAVADRNHHKSHGTVVYTLGDSSHGNPEGIATAGRYFYVGATGDGTIYRGRLGDRTVHTFIPGATGRAAVGLEISRGRLFVAGGPTGQVFVYDLRHPTAAPLTFDTGTGGFLNDLVVTARGDVYVTDSFRPTLWHVAADQVRPGGQVDAISVSPGIPYTPGAFNANGIVALKGGRELIVVNSSDGKLYRIRFGSGGPAISVIDAPPLVGGDGLLRDRGRLIVVRGTPASLTFLKIKHDHARIQQVVTDPTLRGPSTVARLHDRYLVVNADFATGTQPFTVSGLTWHPKRG